MFGKPVSMYNEVDALRAMVYGADSSVDVSELNEAQCLKWIVTNLGAANVGSMQEVSSLKRWVSFLDAGVNVGSMQELQCLRWLVTHFRDGDGGRSVSVMNELDCMRELITTSRAEAPPIDPLPEITRLDFTGLNETTLANPGGPGKGFPISGAYERYGVWFYVTDETEPDLSAYGVTEYIAVGAGVSDTDTAVVLSTALDNVGFLIARDEAVITTTDPLVGTRVDAIDVNTGAIITIIQQGA